eukprot:6204634-Prymnesium_polylepis.1
MCIRDRRQEAHAAAAAAAKDGHPAAVEHPAADTHAAARLGARGRALARLGLAQQVLPERLLRHEALVRRAQLARRRARAQPAGGRATDGVQLRLHQLAKLLLERRRLLLRRDRARGQLGLGLEL